MDINSVIDNEESRFIYVRKCLPCQWVGFIKNGRLTCRYMVERV